MDISEKCGSTFVLLHMYSFMKPKSKYSDDIGSKQVQTEVLVDGQNISNYSLLRRTVDYDLARVSLSYIKNRKTA